MEFQRRTSVEPFNLLAALDLSLSLSPSLALSPSLCFSIAPLKLKINAYAPFEGLSCQVCAFTLIVVQKHRWKKKSYIITFLFNLLFNTCIV